MRERPATVSLLTRLLAAVNRPADAGRGLCPDCHRLVDLYWQHARQDPDGTVSTCAGMATTTGRTR